MKKITDFPVFNFEEDVVDDLLLCVVLDSEVGHILDGLELLNFSHDFIEPLLCVIQLFDFLFLVTWTTGHNAIIPDHSPNLFGKFRRYTFTVGIGSCLVFLQFLQLIDQLIDFVMVFELLPDILLFPDALMNVLDVEF